MKKLYLYALMMTCGMPHFVSAIDEQDVAAYQALNPVETLAYQFEEILRALDHADASGDRYMHIISVGIGLIETASNHGLTITERIIWYRQLLDKHQEVTLQNVNREGDDIQVGLLTKMKAIERVLIHKLMDLFKAYKESQ